MTLKEEKKISNEEFFKFIEEWKKGLSPEDLKSIQTHVKEPVSKLIIEKILSEKTNNEN